jgi:hypothetical protein
LTKRERKVFGFQSTLSALVTAEKWRAGLRHDARQSSKVTWLTPPTAIVEWQRQQRGSPAQTRLRTPFVEARLEPERVDRETKRMHRHAYGAAFRRLNQ